MWEVLSNKRWFMSNTWKNIIIGLLIILCSVNFLTIYTYKKYSILLFEVVDCFKDVDWQVQTFIYGGTSITDKNGNDKFYACKSIDDAIKKLNKRLN